MIRIPVNCVVRKDDLLYLLAQNVNAILKFDIVSKNIDIIGFVPDEIKSAEGLFSKILIWKDNFIFVPYNANNLWMVDVNFKHWNKIELKHKDVKMKFAGAVILNDELFLVKHNYPISVCVDLNSMEIKEMQNMSQDNFAAAYVIDNNIYCPSICSNKLVVYDVTAKSFSEIVVGDEGTTYNYLLYANNQFYLVPRDGNDIVIIQDNKEIDRIKLPEETYPRSIFFFNNELYIPSPQKGKSLKMRDGKIEKFEEEVFWFSNSIDDEVYCLTNDRGFIYLFNRNSNEYDKICVEVDKNDFIEKIGRDAFYSGSKLCKESVFRNLENFVEMLEEPISLNE